MSIKLVRFVMFEYLLCIIFLDGKADFPTLFDMQIASMIVVRKQYETEKCVDNILFLV